MTYHPGKALSQTVYFIRMCSMCVCIRMWCLQVMFHVCTLYLPHMCVSIYVRACMCMYVCMDHACTDLRTSVCGVILQSDVPLCHKCLEAPCALYICKCHRCGSICCRQYWVIQMLMCPLKCAVTLRRVQYTYTYVCMYVLHIGCLDSTIRV